MSFSAHLNNFMNEQQEAKSFHAAQAFINAVYLFTGLANESILDAQTEEERTENVYNALIGALKIARKFGSNKKFFSTNMPFTPQETETIMTHAVLFAFNQLSPIGPTNMSNLFEDALTCAKKFEDENSTSISEVSGTPCFVLMKNEDGKIAMGLSFIEDDDE